MRGRIIVLALVLASAALVSQGYAHGGSRGRHSGPRMEPAPTDSVRAPARVDSGVCRNRTRAPGVEGQAGNETGVRLPPLWDQLGLTTEQLQQLQALQEQDQALLDTLRTQIRAGTLTRDQAEATLQAARQTQSTAVLAVLTPDQVAKLDELKAARQAMADSLRAAAEMALVQRLGLTPEQEQQWQALADSVRSRLDSLRTQVQAGTLTRDQAQTQMHAAQEAYQAALATILTADQLQALERMRGPGRGGRWMGPEGCPAAPDTLGTTQSEEGSTTGDGKVTSEAESTDSSVQSLANTATSSTAVESQSWGAIKSEQP